MVILNFGNNQTGVGEELLAVFVEQPANVIPVKVADNDHIDLFGRDPGSFQFSVQLAGIIRV
jgi:hypothetical protein